MSIRGAIFDLDGTLTDSMAIWDRAPRELVRRHGGRPPQDLAEALREMGRREACGYLRRRFGLAPTVEQLMEEINDIVTEEYRSRVPLKPGAEKLVRRLAAEGTALCVATASEVFQARLALERLGIWGHFAFAVSCIQWGGKTGPAIYQEAARRLGLPPEQVVVFEDALHAARTAAGAGFPVAGVYDDSAAGDRAAMERVCTWYVEDLDEWRESK